MKRIDKLANGGMVVKSGKWTFVVAITYQGDDGTVEVGGLGGRCEAYLEEGFLVDDGEKWRFHDAEGKLVASVRKAALGECSQVSELGDFYVFQKPKNGGKFPGFRFLCVNAKGERIPEAGLGMRVSPKALFAADDPVWEEGEGAVAEAGHRWSELKQRNESRLGVSGGGTKASAPGMPGKRCDGGRI